MGWEKILRSRFKRETIYMRRTVFILLIFRGFWGGWGGGWGMQKWIQDLCSTGKKTGKTISETAINFYIPMMQIGFRMNLSLPMNPMYLDRHPADHNRTMYSTPKKATRQIS